MLTSIAALTGKYYVFSCREMPSPKGFHLINIYNGSLTLFFPPLHRLFYCQMVTSLIWGLKMMVLVVALCQHRQFL